MKVGVGMLTAQRPTGDSRSAAEVYRDLLVVGEEAERLGFDSIWLTEHHFVDDGYMPSLLPVAAALAARTSRITIGTGVLLAPFYDPLRLAEDAATVDLISGGRLILGLGTGWRGEEYAGFGVDPRSVGERLEETVHLLRDAWAGSTVRRSADAAAVSVTPRPDRPSGPPIWIGARRPGGIRRTARIADGLLAARVDAEELAANVGILHQTLHDSGRDRDGMVVGLHTPVIASVRGDAWETTKQYLRYIEWKYADMAAPYAGRTAGSAAADSALDEEVLRAGAITGTPDAVARSIRAFDEAAGAPFHFIARLYWPGLDLQAQLDLLRAFAETVLPILTQAGDGEAA